MATIPLKTITFPGLDNTYTVPQLDDTLSVAGKAADAKATGDKLDELEASEATKANIDGSYDELTSGSAKQLLTDKGITEQVPYLLRASGGNGADREQDKIVGGTVAWNQRYTVTYSNTARGVSVSVVNGTVTITGTSESSGTGATLAWTSFAFQGGHVVVIFKDFSLPSGDFIFEQYSGYGTNADIIGRPFKISAQNQYVIPQLKIANTGVTYNVTGHLSVIDLTQMFGTAIADRAYAMEQSTAGSGIAWLKSMGFFTKDYYPYDAGTLKSVEGLTAHSMVGFNQWDEEREVGGYYTVTGLPWATTDRIRSKNPIQILPNTKYCFIPYTYYNCFVFFYDDNDNFIPPCVNIAESTYIFTTPVNARYLRFNMGAGYGTTYNHDICINLSDPAKNGTYEPYTKHSYPLDSTLTLRGIPKLDANNQVYYDGDEYASDGTVTRRYGIVDLGTLTWQNSGSVFLATISDMVTTTATKVMCAKYSYGTTSFAWASVESVADKTINTSSNDYVYIKDSDYSDYATFKTAMSGVYLVYELATSTTEEADPFQTPQIVDPYGTEEYETTGIVPVGHETFYPENLRSKIEGLPFNFATLIAPTESTYEATRAYSANNLFIVDNILYKATTSIASGGTITPGTNCTATTLAEIIAALS